MKMKARQGYRDDPAVNSLARGAQGGVGLQSDVISDVISSSRWNRPNYL